MKRAFILTFALLAVAGILAAQTTQKPAAPAPAPSAPAQAAPGQAAPAPAAPLGGRPQPQAQSQEEFQAYQAAAAKTTPADAESAANTFATQFPNSELRILLYLRAMREYQNANNAEKNNRDGTQGARAQSQHSRSAGDGGHRAVGAYAGD